MSHEESKFTVATSWMPFVLPMATTSPTLPIARKYDVSLSYAGEDRPYVSQVAKALQSAGIRVFYDEFEETALWGKNLIDELDRIYRLESETVVMFVSAAYLQKDWTNHERRSVLAAAMQARREYVLPVRFDDTELDGMPPTMKWLDARKLLPRDLSERVLAKLAALGIARTKGVEESLSAGGTIAWRIAHSKFALDLLAGANVANRTSGRWNPKGIPLLYAGASFCSALLELLVHLPKPLVADFMVVPLRIPGDMAIETLYESTLPQGWRSVRMYGALQQMGAAWAQSQRTCVLSVPSAATRNERLFLLNPVHPDFGRLEILAPEPLDIDPRLLAGKP